jgi:L-amino acid N-acyltransferase YncA
VKLRRATTADAPAITAIYNEGIASHRATFETELRSVHEIERRIQNANARHAWLVAVDEGEEVHEVIAWAATMPYANRACYDGVAEFSIYVAGAHQGRGAGRLVLEALLAEAEKAGLYKVTSRVFSHNAASRALCASVGFREVGVHLRHARLDGEWRDIVTVEVLLGPAA